MWYVIETPIAQPPVVEPGGAVDITVWITSDENLYARVKIAILDGSTILQESSIYVNLYAFIRQPVTRTFTVTETANPMRNVRVTITDQYGEIPQTFYNIFEVSTAEIEATAAAPTHTPETPVVGQNVLITSLVTVSHPGYYWITINLWEGGAFGQSTNKQFWSKKQQVTFTATSLSKYVNAGGPIETYDGDNLTRSVEIIIETDGVELFKDDWNNERFDVIEPTFTITRPVADHPTRYIGEPQRVSTFITVSHSGTYRVFIDVHEGGIAGPGRFLWGDAHTGGQLINFTGGVGKWVSVSGVAVTYDGDNGTRDTWVRIFEPAVGSDVWYVKEAETDIYNVVKFDIEFERPTAEPQEVAVGEPVTLTARLKILAVGEFIVGFKVTEGTGWIGTGDDRWYEEVTVNSNGDWITAQVTHNTIFPDGDNSSRDVEIHVLDMEHNLLDNQPYGGVFGVHGEDQDFIFTVPQAVPYEAEAGTMVGIITQLTSIFDGTFAVRLVIKEGSVWWSSGDFMHVLPFQEVTFQAGVPETLQFEITSSVRLAGDNGRRDVRTEIYSPSDFTHLLASEEKDDIYRVLEPSVPPECAIDAQCPPDKPFCINGFCVECRDDNDCPEGYYCFNGTCYPEGTEPPNGNGEPGEGFPMASLLLLGLGGAFLLSSAIKKKPPVIKK